MKQSALLVQLRSQGATTATVGEWEVVARVGAIEDDYAAIRHRAGAMDLSHRTMLRVTGNDCVKFLQGIISHDATLLAPGRGLYATILTAKGKMQSDLTAYALKDAAVWVGAEPEVSETLFRLLSRYTIGTDATIDNLSGRYGLLGIYGPNAAAVIESVLGVRPPTAALAVVESVWQGHAATVAESGYPDTPGYRILLQIGRASCRERV